MSEIVKAGVAKAPCKSCPYRQDAPSGVWAEHEYTKLPAYDGTIEEQVLKVEQGTSLMFFCHQRDGCLCAGWLATHGPENLLALRLHPHHVKDEVWAYQSPIPVFASGQEACDHGLADMEEPGKKARKVIDRLDKKFGKAR